MSEPWRKRVEIGEAVLYLGDCLEILPTLGPVDAAAVGVGCGYLFIARRKRCIIPAEE